jgi:hypothetical protein
VEAQPLAVSLIVGRDSPSEDCALHKKRLVPTVENFESRAFPQAFLNHLETAAS